MEVAAQLHDSSKVGTWIVLALCQCTSRLLSFVLQLQLTPQRLLLLDRYLWQGRALVFMGPRGFPGAFSSLHWPATDENYRVSAGKAGKNQ